MTRVATGIKSYPKKQESQLERVGGMFLCRDGENTDRNHQPAYGDFLKWGVPLVIIPFYLRIFHEVNPIFGGPPYIYIYMEPPILMGYNMI